MAIPIASVIAPAMEILVSPTSNPANTTPTAIPSGILCRVTANTSIVDFFNCVTGPSGLSSFKCICGVIVSSNNRNPIPSKNPTAAGIHAIFPCSSAISIAGINSDHTPAAIMTPDANPSNAFCIVGLISFLSKKTIPAPNVVPTKGISIPIPMFIVHASSSSYYMLITSPVLIY